jgi:hypothetical protein
MPLHLERLPELRPWYIAVLHCSGPKRTRAGVNLTESLLERAVDTEISMLDAACGTRNCTQMLFPLSWSHRIDR